MTDDATASPGQSEPTAESKTPQKRQRSAVAFAYVDLEGRCSNSDRPRLHLPTIGALPLLIRLGEAPLLYPRPRIRVGTRPGA